MTRARKQANSSIGSIRIIGGSHRGRKLPVLNADGLRPTTDRTKETLFNWLMLDVQDASCLDCFAGAGSLGFEALSRSAAVVSFMELDKQAARQLRANAALLRYNSEQACVLQGNTLHLLSQFSTTVDIIFIDPPFQQNLVQPCITLIESRDIVKLGTKIYIEREVNGDLLQLPDRWRLIKDKSTQQVSAQLYLVE
ncbi:MAG: 16S rRNA (guanine966-N2)-methyltransferase [Bermanella sp.]|jgi:16S rRNA (guanine966-N2)-methyltransferase|uniref:16S rRNA (guanine(966)-N(2))-methyltransferase RsmD n=1 Tax=Glaciecola sp. 33A TaxID=2057807 RepID=UPI000C32D44E|nr:16S rRNA (guanine(966)-N(2))-methyltransferase RsmD [Glaciecola sp. 33A]PKI00643.1 16S rRNA (guanine(966)-N(2))-methyltransferase RsmD [Glaciecola sp. 33A]